MTTVTLTTVEIVAVLASNGWAGRWTSCPNFMGDGYGGDVGVPTRRVASDRPESGRGRIVEIVRAGPALGAARIAAVIAALATK